MPPSTVVAAPEQSKPNNMESFASSTRVTKEGRTVIYELSVMQQPERARACGSGAKSSTDRRPVDPPPIVRLNIFESLEDSKTRYDITSSYNANFLIYATLENARPIAHGRVLQPQPTPNAPVLTGVPVSAMYHLERPEKAGYFIFSDLSVRHEGSYRLKFTLFEETKEDRDRDLTAHIPGRDAHGQPIPQASRRLEVNSRPFQVFSAKKFPGLTESTTLSRLVADQGCRVRIRRDIRMRKHETKAKDWDSYEDDTASERAHAANSSSLHYQLGRPNTDEAHSSRAKLDGPGVSVVHGKPSIQDLSSPENSTYMSAQQSSGDVSEAYTQQRPGAPPMHYQNPVQYDTSSQMSQQPQMPYSFQSNYPYGQPVPHQPGYSYMPQHYPDPSPQSHQPSSLHDPSVAHATHEHAAHYGPPPTGPRSIGSAQQSPNPATYHHASRSVSIAAYFPTHDGKSFPSTNDMRPVGDRLQSNAISADGNHVESSDPTQAANPAKRLFSSAFNTHYMDNSLRDGARPVPTLSSHGADDRGREESSSDDDAQEAPKIRMTYRRADGTEIIRMVPTF